VYLLENSGSSCCSEWVWEYIHLKPQRPLFKNGDGFFQWPARPTERASTLSSSLGPGRCGGTATIVFNGSAPHIATAHVMAGEQVIAWKMAGTKGLAMIPELEGELEG
jgi:hypothetical protein